MKHSVPVPCVEPDFSGFDSAEELYRDAEKWGLLEDFRALLCDRCASHPADPMRIVRDCLYELAAAPNRDLAVDLLLHITGIAQFGASSLREYGRKHGCTHEWFRRQAGEMRRRLDLPPMPSQRPEAVRAEHRLVNRRNGVA